LIFLHDEDMPTLKEMFFSSDEGESGKWRKVEEMSNNCELN
jgi:hypothetical protein